MSGRWRERETDLNAGRAASSIELGRQAVAHSSAGTRRIASWPEALAWRIEHGLAWLWLLYAVPLTLFLSLNVPPFQAPDEPNHFLRALQVSAGGLVAASLGPGRSGGTVDPAVPSAVAPYLPLMFHPENKLTA